MNQTIPREQILANIERIKAIELDDLIHLERDLDFDEKVNGLCIYTFECIQFDRLIIVFIFSVGFNDVLGMRTR